MEHALSGQTVPAEHERYVPDNLHETSLTSTSVVAATAPASKTPPAPSFQLKPVRRFTYRGVDIIAVPRGDAYRYTAPALSLDAASRRTLYLRINARLFRRDTGITDPALEHFYAGSDTDRDGYLCWKEIREFQERLTHRYKYRYNTTTLSPDEFLDQGAVTGRTGPL